MFLKVTSTTTGDEMYINVDNIKCLVPTEGFPTEGYRTLVTFIDGDSILVEESIDELMEDEDEDY